MRSAGLPQTSRQLRHERVIAQTFSASRVGAAVALVRLQLAAATSETAARCCPSSELSHTASRRRLME